MIIYNSEKTRKAGPFSPSLRQAWKLASWHVMSGVLLIGAPSTHTSYGSGSLNLSIHCAFQCVFSFCSFYFSFISFFVFFLLLGEEKTRCIRCFWGFFGIFFGLDLGFYFFKPFRRGFITGEPRAVCLFLHCIISRCDLWELFFFCRLSCCCIVVCCKKRFCLESTAPCNFYSKKSCKKSKMETKVPKKLPLDVKNRDHGF